MQDIYSHLQFRNNGNALVIGSNGGLGRAISKFLFEQFHKISNVFTCSREPSYQLGENVNHFYINIEDESSVVSAAQKLAGIIDSLDIVVVATGILQDLPRIVPEKNMNGLNLEQLSKVFQVNTFGPAILIKHFSPLLSRKSKSVFALLSARVGSISDNKIGGWYSYRSSKAGLNMIVKTAAIVIKRKNPSAVCFSIHPGTVETNLSAPFKNNKFSKNSFSPEQSAEKIVNVINDISPSKTGSFVSYDGSEILF